MWWRSILNETAFRLLGAFVAFSALWLFVWWVLSSDPRLLVF